MLLIKQKHETSFIQCSAVYEKRTYGATGGAGANSPLYPIVQLTGNVSPSFLVGVISLIKRYMVSHMV